MYSRIKLYIYINYFFHIAYIYIYIYIHTRIRVYISFVDNSILAESPTLLSIFSIANVSNMWFYKIELATRYLLLSFYSPRIFNLMFNLNKILYKLYFHHKITYIKGLIIFARRGLQLRHSLCQNFILAIDMFLFLVSHYREASFGKKLYNSWHWLLL